MSETDTVQAQAAQSKGLHPWSFLFMLGGMSRQVAAPLVALLFLGGSWSRASMVAAAVACGVTLWLVLTARAYRYQLDADTLHIREGLLGRTQRHIPFVRIHNISQRRKLLHRLLNVTELHLESASGGKPEAVMRVLGVQDAAALEALLRAHHLGAGQVGQGGLAAADPGGTETPQAATATPDTELLHALPWTEVLRLGIASNRGMVMVAVAFGAAFQGEFLRKHAVRAMTDMGRWASNLVNQEVQAAHTVRLGVAIASLVLLAWLLTRVLSIALAFFRYHRFRLERQGERLMAAHGLSTQVRSAARLGRLQRWQIDENWLHRRMQRCSLGVTVAGGTSGRRGGQGAEPSLQFTELAPIATWPQALALLSVTLPALDWAALQWQPLHTAWVSRLWSQGRWLVPGVGALLALATAGQLGVPAAVAWALAVPALMAWLAYTRAWAQFAAYAIAGPVVVFRSGVWHRRWVMVETSRLHVLRLHSSPLDRRLGVVSFQATAQGGSKSYRTLEIPYMPLAVAQGLRAQVWGQISV
ncbi:MAG: hypothetical protein CFE43_11425 [Burkholderiales bacterium PBB3]|nr:MAG: hypothetical protein CFE43_11425 [Burkholderiales bacterium PBB3]